MSKMTILGNLHEELKDPVLEEPVWLKKPITEAEAKFANEQAKGNIVKPNAGVAATLGKSLLALCLHSREKLEDWDEIILANDVCKKLSGNPVQVELSDSEIKFLEKLMDKAKTHMIICARFINECNIGRAMSAKKEEEP